MTLGRKRMRHEQLTFLASFISPWSWGLSPVPLVTIELCDISSSDPRCNTRKKNPSRLGQHPQQTTQFLSPRPFIRKKRLLLSTNCWMRKAQIASISDVLLFHSATAGRQAVWHQRCVHILDAPRGFLLGSKSRWKLPKKNPKHAGTQIK